MRDIYEELIQMRQSGTDGILVTVTDKQGHGPAIVGKKLLVLANGNRKGTVGGGELEYSAIKKARELIEKKANCTQSYEFTDETSLRDYEKINMICGGRVTLFYEYIPTCPNIYIIGAGHVGRCLVEGLKNLDYRVTVIEERQEAVKGITDAHKVLIGDYSKIIRNEKIPAESYVVITGYSHEVDYQILKSMYEAHWKPKYIGLLASPKKAKLIIAKIKAELGERADLSMLYSPVGLDIGGDTPEEIAISIVSEIQAIRYKKIRNPHSWHESEVLTPRLSLMQPK